MQRTDLNRIGYFEAESMFKEAGNDVYLLSNGDALIIPKGTLLMTLQRPSERLPTYSKVQIENMITWLKDLAK